MSATPWFPVAVDARYEGARAGVDPRRSRSWLGRLWPLVRSHLVMFVIALGALVVSLVLQLLIPRVLMGGIDNALVARTSSLTPYVLALVGLAIGRGITLFVARYLLLRNAYNLEYDLRTIVYEHLSRLSFSFYDRVQSGQLISRANSDIRSVQMYLTFAPFIVLQCLSAVFAFAIMLTIDVPLALVAMSTMPFVYVVSVAMRKRIFPIAWVMQARLADVATIVDENVNGARVVKAFAAEQRQLSVLEREARRVKWTGVRDADIRARWTPLIENLPRLGLALILLYGGYLVIHGETTVGAIVAFNAYVLQLQAPFRMLGALLMWSQRARASAGRIFEVLDEPVEIVDHPGAVDLIDARGDVRFEGVHFAYPDGTEVLRGLDLHLRAGETVAIVGRTGSGKSTVARLVPRFYDVTAGRVAVDGADVRELTVASLRAGVGVVLDEPFLFSVSVHDNIAYARPDATREEVVAAARAAQAHEFVVELEDGYDTVVGERGYTLSGGQRQRLAIARTLLANPPVLILDDATSAIDVRVEEQIHDALQALMQGRTTLVIAHRISTISLADRVVLLDGGRVAADGTHAQLLAREPRYREVLAQAAAEEAAAWSVAAMEEEA